MKIYVNLIHAHAHTHTHTCTHTHDTHARTHTHTHDTVSGDAFKKAAEIHHLLDTKHEAASCYTEAAQVLKRDEPKSGCDINSVGVAYAYQQLIINGTTV